VRSIVENVLPTSEKASVIHALFGAIGRELNLLPLAEQIGRAPRRSKDKNCVAYCNEIRTADAFLFNCDFQQSCKKNSSMISFFYFQELQFFSVSSKKYQINGL
jgi:hypothetical protein